MKVFYKQVQLNPTTETDYTDLVNKPSLNGVELEGDLSTEQIKVTWYGTQEEFDALPSHDPYTFYIIDDGTPVGTQDSYLDLADKPSINGQVLTGNKLPSDLDMYSRPDVDNLLASMRSIKVVATKPAAPAANTMYYVGPDSESNYHVYLYDALLNEIDLGMAMNQLYREGTAIDIDSANTISVKIDDATIKTNTNNEIYVKKLDTTLTKGANTADAVKAVWVENGDVKEHTVNSGTSTRPVYIDAGTIKPVNQAASGTYTNFVPYVANNGVLDGGQFIDFHTPTSTQDYDYRLFYNEGETDLQVKKAPSVPGATILTTAHLDGTTLQWNNTNKTAYVNNSDTIVGTTNADKIGMTKGAIQKYTDTLVSGGDTAIIIPADSDLNTVAFTEVGNYVCGRSADVQTLVNCPTSIGFKMVVESLNSHNVAALSSSVTWDYRLRTIKGLDGSVFKQRVYTDGTGAIIWGDWVHTLTGETTANGNRWDVYPYTTSTGNTTVGKSVCFYTSDDSDGYKAVLQWDDASRKLYLGDYTQSTATVSTVLTSNILDDSTIKYDTSTNKVTVPKYNYDASTTTPTVTPGFVYSNTGILEIGPTIDFHAAGQNTDYSVRMSHSTSSIGDLRLDNHTDGSRSGTIFTTGITKWRDVTSSCTFSNGFSSSICKVYDSPNAIYLAIDGTTTAISADGGRVIQFPTSVLKDADGSSKTLVGYGLITINPSSTSPTFTTLFVNPSANAYWNVQKGIASGSTIRAGIMIIKV